MRPARTDVKVWRHFDVPLLLIVLCLIAIGLAMIHSATFDAEAAGGIDGRVVRQAASAALGLVFLAVLVSLDYRVLARLGVVMYVLAVALLAAVMFLGRQDYGAQRWVDLGFFQFQPSEPAKLFMVAVLAKYFAANRESIHRFRHIVLSLAIVSVPLVLTVVQPDLGTALVYAAIWLGIAIVAGLRLRHLGFLFGAAVVLAPVFWSLMPAYQRSRINVFLNPDADPLGAGYNVIQATISVGAGGLLGRGFLSGTQSQLRYLRVQYADFIFAVLAEELGFVGVLALFALFGLLLYRALRAAYVAGDVFGRLLAVGIVSMIAFQFFVNVGMNVGVLPVTGIPLPLISYGGSSMVTLLASVGVLESVITRHRRFELV